MWVFCRNWFYQFFWESNLEFRTSNFEKRRILCKERGDTLVGRVVVADRMWTRMKGLLGYRRAPCNTAMVIRPCNQVHTFFMRFSIGVVFLDSEGVVLGKELLHPWRVSSRVKEACAVVEVAPSVMEMMEIGAKLIITE